MPLEVVEKIWAKLVDGRISDLSLFSRPGYTAFVPEGSERSAALKEAADVALGFTYGDDAYDAINGMYLTPAEAEQVEHHRLESVVAALEG
jgi:hypothetical protein